MFGEIVTLGAAKNRCVVKGHEPRHILVPQRFSPLASRAPRRRERVDRALLQERVEAQGADQYAAALVWTCSGQVGSTTLFDDDAPRASALPGTLEPRRARSEWHHWIERVHPAWTPGRPAWLD